MILTKPLKIVATILAKNEADIIADNIEHHLNHGVTHFIITDNASSDETRTIASKYPEVVEIIDELGDNHHQSAWVTRMARLACKLKPDWIVHLDADELWCGLGNLRKTPAAYVSSNCMYLHPPINSEFSLSRMRHYLDFDGILPGECKVAHRPDENITITHGNHGFEGLMTPAHYTNTIWRHHYPIRSFEQFSRKAIEGHRSLMRRGVVCERWKRWHDLAQENKLRQHFDETCDAWSRMISSPSTEDLLSLLRMWSTPEVVSLFELEPVFPVIRSWPVTDA